MTDFQIIYSRRNEWDSKIISFPEMFLGARYLRDLVAGARLLRPEDLIEPSNQLQAQMWDIADLEARAKAVLKLLDGALSSLQSCIVDLGTIIGILRNNDPSKATEIAEAAKAADKARNALLASSWFGVQGSIPAAQSGITIKILKTLLDQANRVFKDLGKRKGVLPATSARPEDLIKILQDIFGRPFVVLARFKPANGNDLQKAFNDSNKLLPTDPVGFRRWIEQLSYVRPAISRFDLAFSLSQILAGTPSPVFTIGQLPYKQNDIWLANSVPLQDITPQDRGRISLTTLVSEAYDPHKSHSGLLIDEWTERIPNVSELTGISFHYEEPKSRAPQCLLLAVCPNENRIWTSDILLAILNETMDLAKIRTVDLASLKGVGQILPALYFPMNLGNATIATRFAAISVAEQAAGNT